MGRKVQPQTQSSKCHLCIYPTCFSKSNIILFRNCDIACCETQTGDMGTPPPWQGLIKPLTLFLLSLQGRKQPVTYCLKRVGDIDVGLVPSSLRIRGRGRKKPVTYSDLPSLTTLLWVSRLKDLSHALTSWQLISHAFSKSQTFGAVAFALKLDINR